MKRPLYETSSGDGDGPRPSISGGAANERGDAAHPSREALAAALVNHNQRRTPYSDLTIGPIVAAARERLAQMRRPCRDCEGTGEEWASEAMVDKQECFQCGGRGVLYPSALVERIAQAIAFYAGEFFMPKDTPKVAVALLDALGSVYDNTRT